MVNWKLLFKSVLNIFLETCMRSTKIQVILNLIILAILGIIYKLSLQIKSKLYYKKFIYWFAITNWKLHTNHCGTVGDNGNGYLTLYPRCIFYHN